MSTSMQHGLLTAQRPAGLSALPACAVPCSRKLSCRIGRSSSHLAAQKQLHHAATPPLDRLSVAGDAEKEESRKFRRVTFDHELWASHRSTNRYWRHMASMPRSRVVKALAVPMTYVGIVATMVCCYEAMLERHMLPDWGWQWPGLAVSTTGVYSLSTFALSLLLVFRTNSSYHRWNDARKLWGLTTNRSRDLARQVLQWMTDPADAELAASACRLIRAFPIALMASLRTDHDLRRDLGAVLQPAELDLVLQQPHTGTAILQALGSVVAASHIKELQKLRIDENITVMQDTMGGCERIFRTPIPLVYTRHTSRFLLCWLTILPFCTAGQVGWLTVPIACVMAFFLLGIEEIGVQVEEPFGILALEQFCDNISKNVIQAESAAAAMQALAQSHAFQTSILQAALSAGATTDTASVSSSSSIEAGASTSSQQGSSSSRSGASPGPLSWRPRSSVLVAGQQVPAAEQAYAMGSRVKLQAAADYGSSSDDESSDMTEFALQKLDLSGSKAAAAASQLSSASTASLGSRDREYEPAPNSSEDAGQYWPSSVSGGAANGDAADYPF